VYDRPVTGGSPGLYRVVDAGGILTVSTVTASGSTITLGMQGRPQWPATVTYGYSKSPAAAWVKDAAGTAVALFQEVPVQ